MHEHERWTIPFEIVIWTALSGGVIAVLVIFLLNG
jgi:hypothetical protein